MTLRVNDPDGLPSGMDPVVWWWGSDLVPTPVTLGQSLAAVTRATALIVNTITALPWLRMSGDPLPMGLSTVGDTGAWLSDPMRLRPRDGVPSPQAAALLLSRGVFWAQWIRSALWYGMGYLVFVEDSAGLPLAGTLRVLNPHTVSPQYDDPDLGVRRRIGSQSPRSYGGFVETDMDGRFDLGGTRYRLVELRNPTADVDEFGIAPGVLSAHAGELAQAQAAVTYGRGTLRSGVPAGYLKVSTPTFGPDDARALKASWMAAHGNDNRSIAVLNSTTEFQPIALSPVDMALIEMRRMSLLDIANAFGVPAYMIGGTDGGSNTYSNSESRNRDFLTFSLMPWASTVEDVLSSLLPGGSWVEVDFSGLLRPDSATRYAANAAAVGGPWKTVDEMRAEENLPPLPAEPEPEPEPVPAEPEPEPAPEEVPADEQPVDGD